MNAWNMLRYAARQLVKKPAFSLTVIITLGLCIGVNTAVYTVVDTLFFKPLPYPEPSKLALVTTAFTRGQMSGTNTSQDGSQWELVRDNASLVEGAVYGGAAGVNLVTGSIVQYVIDQRVSANYFHVLGIAPLLGRGFTRLEDVPNGPALTVLGYGVWQRVFHGDRNIIGRTIDLRGAPHIVIGVMPEGFRTIPTGEGDVGTAEPADLWTPLQPSTRGEGEGDNYGVIARLKPGATFEQANAQLTALSRDFFAKRHLPKGVTAEERLMPLKAGLTYDSKDSVHLVLGAVILVLLIGCVNIAGLLLARSATRSREIATRMALGAGRHRVLGELFVEAFLLALAGGAVGLVFGYAALQALVGINPGEFTMFGAVHLDWRVMGIMMLVSIATSILFGLVPAWEASAVDLRSALAEAGRSAAGSRRQWKRRILVFAEVALAVVLVVSAGLVVRTFAKLANTDPGFDPNHIITATASLQDARYATAAAGARLFHESLEQIRRIPGVESAAVALSPPYARPLNIGTQIEGTTRKGITNATYVTPGIFATLRMHLLSGRDFSDADNATSEPVVVVNEAFVKRYLSGIPGPVGAYIDMSNKKWRVIGVVNDVEVKMGWNGTGPLDRFAGIYIPASQFPDGLFGMANVWFSPTWIVRTHGDIPGLRHAMSDALASVDPRLPFSGFKTSLEVRGATLQPQRYRSVLFSVLAGLAVLLALLGLYGLIAQSVSQRTREMGIRLALGATTAQVIRTAAVPGLTLSLAGIGAGIVLALFATRYLKSIIWGLSGTDPGTYVSVGLSLIAIAGIASLIPALRLTRLDPAQTLRDE